MRYESVLQELSKSFVFGVNYTHENGERYFALVTASDKYAPEDIVKEVDSNELLENFIFWDIFTEQRLCIPVDVKNAFYFKQLSLLGLNDVDSLLHVTKQTDIDRYNQAVIEIYNERRDSIIQVKVELEEVYKMTFTEEEMHYYISLFNTHYFTNFEASRTYLIKLCMLLKSTPYKLLKGDVNPEDLETAKEQWMLVIRQHIELAKAQLDEDATLLDIEDETYDDDLEEFTIIKELLDDIPEEFQDDLDECESYVSLLETWPPLLLPAPPFIIDQPSGMNAFERLDKKIEWKHYN